MCFGAFGLGFRNMKKCLFLSRDLLLLQPLRKRSLRVKRDFEKGLKKTFKKSRKGFGNKKQNTTFATASKEKFKSKKRPKKGLEKNF